MILYPATTTLSSVVRGGSLNQICPSTRDSLWYVDGVGENERYSKIDLDEVFLVVLIGEIELFQQS